VKDDNPALEGERYNNPGREETTYVRDVGDSLTPAVFVEHVHSEPPEPDNEHGDEGHIVGHRKEGEVETGTLSEESWGPDVHVEGQRVAYDTYEDDNRQDVGVEYSRRPLKLDV